MPNSERFDAQLRARCSVMLCGKSAVEKMICGKHYLRRWPGVVVSCYAMLLDGRTVGACVYALPPRETAKRYMVRNAWELARLWISDEMPRNSETWFVSQTVRHIRKTRPDVDLLVSYADPSANHVGTIYRAGNWMQDGRTDDERKSPRCDYWVGDKKYSRKAHVPEGAKWERRPRVSKFRFIYWLDGTHEKRRREAAQFPTGPGVRGEGVTQ